MSQLEPGRASAAPAARFAAPRRAPLAGRLVTLVPLSPDHAEDLYAQTHGERREALWRFIYVGPFPDIASFRADLELKAVATDMIFFTIIDNRSGRALGYQAYLNMEPEHRAIEVGAVLLGEALQRTTAATEAHYLFAANAFETIGCRRYVWKCDVLNEKSRAAALRLGFSYEGLFRQHMILKGRNRDTAWFSMLDSEWPARKAAFEAFLDPANFDADGRQKTALSALNGRPGAADRR